MSTFNKSLIAAALALAASSSYAVPMFEQGGNDIGFYAYENQYRLSTDCTPASPCINDAATNVVDANANTWMLVDPTVAGNTIQGDVFAGVLKVRDIYHYADGTSWSDGMNGVELTGYFAQQILNDPSVTPGPTPGTNILQLGAPTSDPFSLLSGGAQLSLFLDNALNFNLNGTAASSLGTAIDGTPWGNLGTIASNGGDAGYDYTIDNPLLAGAAQFTDKNYLALNLLLPTGSAYNAGQLGLVNDASESLQGGVTGGNFTTCSPTDITNVNVICTNFAGNDDIRANPNGPLGSATPSSPWYYIANDPLSITVPEPATVALMGLGLLGIAGLRRRRNT